MKKAMLFLATLFLSSSMVLSAASLPLTGINTVETFLNDATYFNGYNELNAIDFSGKWGYTAIGFEAGNTNEVAIQVGGTATFTTADTSNWGLYEEVNFNNDGLFFTDATNGPNDIALDPFSGAGNFRVFELTADSNLLSYLNNQIVLTAGTIIVGFGDGLGDADFDDIVLALKPVPVPAALFLFAPALLGLFGLRRKASLAS